MTRTGDGEDMTTHGTTAAHDTETDAAWHGERGSANGDRPVSWTFQQRAQWEEAVAVWEDALEDYCKGNVFNARGRAAQSRREVDYRKWLRFPRRQWLAYASDEAKEYEYEHPRPLWSEWLERARRERYLENEHHVEMIRDELERMRDREAELRAYLATDLGDMVDELRRHGVEWGELEQLTGKSRKALDTKRKEHLARRR